MKNKKDFYKLSELDKDKIMFFYFAPNGTGKKFWDNKIKELKKGDKYDKRY